MSNTMPSEATQQLNDVRSIVLQYVGQLCNGCGTSSCTESMCDTGRRNIAPPNKPTRKWTPRSARAIAITIASGPSPRKHLCSSYAATVNVPALSAHEVESAEGPRDPSSFMQLLCDMPSIRRLCSASEQISVRPRACEDLSRSLDPLISASSLEVALQADNFVSNATAAKILCKALKALLKGLPQASPAQWAYAESFIISGGAYPAVQINTPTDSVFNLWLSLLDALNNEPALRLLSKIVHAISLRTHLEDSLAKLKGEDEKTGSHGRNPRRILPTLIDNIELTDCWHGAQLLGLYVWLKKVFLIHWSGTSTTVARGSVECGALELSEALFKVSKTMILDSVSFLPILARYLDAADIAESWIKSSDDSGSRHLLSFSFLFTPKERAIYFRTINHLKMRQAHASADKAVELRRRMTPHSYDDEPEGQLKYNEEHYLLLNVSRSNLLRDAYDQLWQRRKGELLRPLRVRLGEIEELEVGHDLGGVQMEFFNLVCKEAFAEEAGMFTTDARTGISYFRPGSLQPLYMVELFGVLMALAIFNGITLPVSLPMIFYRVLLGERIFHCCLPDHITNDGGVHAALRSELMDGWPTEIRSMTAILDHDIPDLEYSFPLEANGLRLSVHLPKEDHEMEVVTASGSGSEEFQQSEVVDWPGWRLRQSTVVPLAVDRENKVQYVTDYIYWLVWYSVLPQWTAFRRGFHHVIDLHSLSLFTPYRLKAFVEGSSRLDINDLRKATKYEGYEAKSKYIHNFWRIVASWPEKKQKQLLKFVTAAERIPLGGASNLTFVISRAAVEDLEYLPTSSTCFGTLSLPRYPTAEILNEKLSLAVKYGMEGFGTG